MDYSQGEVSMKRSFNSSIVLVVLILASTAVAFAQRKTPDPLAPLKRAISQASAPALSATQETALTTLITQYRDSLPDERDETIENARESLDAAILAGDLAAAQVQITIISTRVSQLQDARMVAEARLAIGSIAVLKSGGQYDLLVTKYGTDRLLQLVTLTAPLAGLGDGPGGGRR